MHNISVVVDRFEYDDERLQKLLFMIHECFRVVDMTGGILNLFPWVRHIAPTLSGYKPLCDAHQPIWSFLQEVVNETKENVSSERPKSFINSYLDELINKSKGENIHSSFSGKHFKHSFYFIPFDLILVCIFCSWVLLQR